MTSGCGTAEDPWQLKTAPGSSDYTMYRDEAGDPPALVCQVGTTTLKYHLSAIDDLHAWLREQGDWVPLGAADEQKDAAPAPSRRGVARTTTRSAAGTACGRAIGVGSGCICRRSSRPSGSPS